MNKRFEAILTEEENRAAREFHSASTKGRSEQKLAKAVLEAATNADEDVYIEDIPTFERFQKRARR